MLKRTLTTVLVLLSVAPVSLAATGDKPTAPAKATSVGTATALATDPAASWVNTETAPMAIDIADPPDDPLFVQLGRDSRPYRILIPRTVRQGLHIDIPAGATVQMWDRQSFAEQPTNPFATAARWEAVPRLVVGPAVIAAGSRPGLLAEVPAWSTASGQFRAFPEGEIPVTVHVNNTGIGAWHRPRVRLFAPDNWTVTPEVAEVISPAKKSAREDAPSITEGDRGVLPPTMTGTATFTVRIPKRAVIGSTAPLVAFLRYDAGNQTITVQNSVDVTIQEPIERRYAMNEAGDKFIVHLMNRFAPLPLGTPSVEVRRPAGTDWSVKPPQAVEVYGNADAVARVGMEEKDSAPADEVRVPVVVTLKGLRMGYTPVVHTAARYGKPHTGLVDEKGVQLLREAAPVQVTEEGICPAPDASEKRLAFTVAERFAVSDPAQFVSPTWVTVTFVNRSAKRLRVEYDAWGSDAPAVASDRPLTTQAGATTLTFLLPDARFQDRLPGKADLVLNTFDGDICVTAIHVAKWKVDLQ